MEFFFSTSGFQQIYTFWCPEIPKNSCSSVCLCVFVIYIIENCMMLCTYLNQTSYIYTYIWLRSAGRSWIFGYSAEISVLMLIFVLFPLLYDIKVSSIELKQTLYIITRSQSKIVIYIPKGRCDSDFFWELSFVLWESNEIIRSWGPYLK